MATQDEVKIKVIVNGADEGARSFGDLEKSMFKSSLAADLASKAISGALGVVQGGIGAVAGLAKQGFTLATSFEQQLSQIKALTGATNEQLDAIKKLSYQLGQDTQYSALEAAQGIEELLKAGVSLTDVLNGGAAGALNLAAAGGIEVADAAEIASTALNAFSRDALTVTDAANALAGAANASATDVMQLKLGLSQVAAVASGAGLSFKDTSTALAVLAQNGLKSSDAGTSLKTMLLNLQPITNTQIELFQQLGLLTTKTTTAFVEDTAAMAKNKDKIAELNTKISILNQKQAEFTSKTKESTKAANAAQISRYRAEIQKLSGAVGKTKTSTEVIGNVFYDASGKLKSLSEISGILHDKLKDLTDQERSLALEQLFGTDALRAANILYKEGAEGVTGMAEAMSKFTAADVAAERVNNLAGAIDYVRSTIETKLTEAFSAPLPGMKLLVRGFGDLLNSLNISAGLTVLKGTFDQMKPSLISIWQSVKDLGDVLVQAGIPAALGEIARSMGATFTQLIIDQIKRLADQMSKFIEYLKSPSGQKALEDIKSLIIDIGSSSVGAARGAIEFTKAIQNIAPSLQSVINALQDLKKVYDLLKGIKDLSENPISYGASGKGIFGNVQKYFHFASGTQNAPGGWSVVGEQGRELVYVPRGSKVLSNRDSSSAIMKALQGFMGTTNNKNVNFNAPISFGGNRTMANEQNNFTNLLMNVL